MVEWKQPISHESGVKEGEESFKITYSGYKKPLLKQYVFMT